MTRISPTRHRPSGNNDAGARLASCFLALALLLGIPKAAVAQASQTSDARQVEALLSAAKDEEARGRILLLLKPDFAPRQPGEAAELVRQLSDIAGRSENWNGVYEALLPVSEHLAGALQGAALDAFLFDVALAAGMAKRFDAQDAWLGRAVSVAVDEAGEGADRALVARANAAYSLLNADRDGEALSRMIGTLDAMEAHQAAALFFNTAGQAGDAFFRLAGKDSGATVFQHALDARLTQTDTGPGKGFLWFNAGVFLRDTGDFDGAIRLQQDAMNLLFRYFGPNSREGLSAYDGLAQTLHTAGNLPAAEAAYRYVYGESLKALGEDDPDVWRIANNLGAVLRSLGLPQDALEFDRFAYDKRFAALGGGAGDTVVSLFNTAQDLVDARRWNEARDVLAAIGRITAGPRYDPRYRAVIARWQDYVAFRSGARTLDRSMLEARGLLVDGMDIEQWLAFLDLYADRAEETGWNEGAQKFRAEALERAREKFGPTHPASFGAALADARLMERWDEGKAVAAYRALDRSMFDWTRANVSASGSLASGFRARVLSSDMRGALAEFATRNREAAAAYAASLDQWKTLSSHAERELRREAETTGDGDYRQLIETYLNATGRLREIVTVSLFSADLMPLDKAMREARGALNEKRQALGLPAVRPWIESENKDFEPAVAPGEGDVIVEFAVTYEWPEDGMREPLGVSIHAVVSRHGRAPEVTGLGRIAFTQGEGDFGGAQEVARKTATLLAEAGAQARTVTVVPDDFLFQNPFAEMRIADGRRLGEAVNLRVATSRQAYAFRDRHDRFARQGKALLVGGLTAADGDGAAELPATGREVRGIAGIAKRAGRRTELLTGRNGTERRVKEELRDASVLHLATHGFFEAQEGTVPELFNAGFTLAGARGTASETDADNVVYARELLSWNLRGVDLVVIAACDTALGDLGLTSTLRGLPLALSIAGARRALLAVDKVPDAATARFMTRFYEHLVEENLPYADAFLATKRDAWAGRIKGVPPEAARAFILFEN